ncbi:Fe-S cluster assembly ATPase SufC [Candidatus Babeliales bacterium]|nr:Fe-S cluster assembly ATPase SufC [Candidatus Babeliales bacterium]
MLLSIKALKVHVDGKEILKNVHLQVREGETHAVLGQNGSGKSSLAYVIMGHPKYKIISGELLFNNKKFIDLSPDKRAKEGLFLAFQHPYQVNGVPLIDFLRQSYNVLYKGTDRQLGVKDFRCLVEKKAEKLKLDKNFLGRPLNVGFSGGEKKKAEALQLLVLQPKLVILDEIDSGLDIDSVKIVGQAIKALQNQGVAFIIVSHNLKILNYLNPKHIHIMRDGSIKEVGGIELIKKLETSGFSN